MTEQQPVEPDVVVEQPQVVQESPDPPVNQMQGQPIGVAVTDPVPPEGIPAVPEPDQVDPVEAGHVTDTGDHIVDQSQTVATEPPDANPPHPVDQSQTVATEPPPAQPEHLVDPPPPAEQAFPEPDQATADVGDATTLEPVADPAGAEPVPQPAASEPAPVAVASSSVRSILWLGIAGMPSSHVSMRLPGDPRTYKPGDYVELSDDQLDALRKQNNLFEGDVVQSEGG